MVDYETLKKLVDEGLSQRQIGDKIGKSQTNVRHWLAKHGLKTTRGKKVEHINDIRSERKKAATLNCVYCGDQLTAHKRKYCSPDCQADYEFEERLVGGNPPSDTTSATIKRWLTRPQQRGYGCETCGYTEWRGQPISLELHHIDGDYRNNKFDNLQLLCPNCHSQTDNYGARNNLGRHYRMKRYYEGKSY